MGRRGRRPARQIAIEPLSAPMTAGRRPELERRCAEREPRQAADRLARFGEDIEAGPREQGNGARA
jgi:hypothetical protein